LFSISQSYAPHRKVRVMAHTPLHLGVPEQRLNEPAATTRTMPIGLGDILRRADLLSDMAEVERQMLARTASRSPLLTAAGAYTVAAGGKRLRAALVLLSARLGAYDPGRALHPAIAIELLHAASLIHDDLVDHAGQRRGHVTVHTRWGRRCCAAAGGLPVCAGGERTGRRTRSAHYRLLHLRSADDGRRGAESGDTC
jgi:hypothetical protein